MRPFRALACIACVAFVVAATPAAAASAESLTVVFNRATVRAAPQHIATVVIGNPAIADAIIQNNQMVVTGKGFGSTNIMLLDPGGQTLAEYIVRVIGQPDDTVTVFRGVDRMTYACAPRCETTPVLGDSEKYFEMVLKQSDARDKQATGPGTAAGAR